MFILVDAYTLVTVLYRITS